MKGHIRARGAGSWELKYDIGRDPLTGRRVSKYATVHGAKRDAQRELRRLLKTVDDGMHSDPGRLTVADWLNQWLDEARYSVSPKTLERYREIVEKHLVPNLGALPLGKLQPMHIQNYYTKALASGRCDGKGGLAPQTVRHHDRVLNVALKRARSLRLIPGNPVDDVKRPMVERREVEVMEPDEAAALLRTADGTRLHTSIFLALGTGVRRGELLALRWSDIDTEKRTLTVNQSLEQTKDGLRFKAPKTKRSRRTIALSPSVVEVLQAHKVRQLEERVSLGLGRNQSGLVFTRHDGAPINPRNFSKEFTRIVKRAGIRPVTFHGLRHTHLTNLLLAGVHPKIAIERAGHASIATTMDIYSHAVPGLQEDAAMRIDAALRTALGQ